MVGVCFIYTSRNTSRPTKKPSKIGQDLASVTQGESTEHNERNSLSHMVKAATTSSMLNNKCGSINPKAFVRSIFRSGKIRFGINICDRNSRINPAAAGCGRGKLTKENKKLMARNPSLSIGHFLLPQLTRSFWCGLHLSKTVAHSTEK